MVVEAEVVVVMEEGVVVVESRVVGVREVTQEQVVLGLVVETDVKELAMVGGVVVRVWEAWEEVERKMEVEMETESEGVWVTEAIRMGTGMGMEMETAKGRTWWVMKGLVGLGCQFHDEGKIGVEDDDVSVV